MKNSKILNISGVKSAALPCGIKKDNIIDLLLVTFADNSTVAGAFTTSAIVSDTVTWNKKILATNNPPKALLVNSGNANCFTGKAGMHAITEITSALAKSLNISSDEIFICSTGVIGQKLPYDKIVTALPQAINNLSEANLPQAAQAIMTTDTKTKGISVKSKIAGAEVSISAIAKGAGMAAPNLATVLSYIFTDAVIAQDILQEILAELIEDSFNAFTIDGDMSTNDTLLMFATGQANNIAAQSKNDPILKQFKADLKQLMVQLCDDIVKDGEGVTKIVKIHVAGAESKIAAKNVALNIANSPLVKTAIYGADPNWGRIVMAVGKSKEKVNLANFSLDIGGFNIVAKGELNPDYNEKNSTAPYMKNNELIDIFVNLGVVQNEEHDITVTSCDLSKGYIEINADYRS